MIKKRGVLALEVCPGRFAIQPSENIQMGVKVGRVPVIVTRLFEVDAIGLDVPLKCREQNAFAGCTPTGSTPELRQQRPEVIKPECFTGPMRIRTEVRGEVSLQVPGVQIQEFQDAKEDGRRQVRRILEEVEGPQPGDRAQ